MGIPCHHNSPKHVSYEVTACEFLGQVMSLELLKKKMKIWLQNQIKVNSVKIC